MTKTMKGDLCHHFWRGIQGRQRGVAYFWRVFSVTAWAMMLTILGWEMPCMMDASKGSPSLIMIAAKSSMTCTKEGLICLLA